MAYVFDEAGIVLLCHARTASRAFRAWALDAGARQVGHHHGLPGAWPAGYDGLSVVRDHTDALLSWHYKLRKAMDVAAFVRDFLAGRVPTDGFASIYGGADLRRLYPWAERSRYVFHYEHMGALPAAFEALGLPPLTLGVVGRSEARRQHMPEEARRLVMDHFADEREILGYA